MWWNWPLSFTIIALFLWHIRSFFEGNSFIMAESIPHLSRPIQQGALPSRHSICQSSYLLLPLAFLIHTFSSLCSFLSSVLFFNFIKKKSVRCHIIRLFKFVEACCSGAKFFKLNKMFVCHCFITYHESVFWPDVLINSLSALHNHKKIFT